MKSSATTSSFPFCQRSHCHITHWCWLWSLFSASLPLDVFPCLHIAKVIIYRSVVGKSILLNCVVCSYLDLVIHLESLSKFPGQITSLTKYNQYYISKLGTESIYFYLLPLVSWLIYLFRYQIKYNVFWLPWHWLNPTNHNEWILSSFTAISSRQETSTLSCK